MAVILSFKACVVPFLVFTFSVGMSGAVGSQRSKPKSKPTSQKARRAAPKPAVAAKPEAKPTPPTPFTFSGPAYFAEKLPSPTGRFPENTSIFRLKPEFDTEAFCRNPRDPRYGGRLPYIGDSTYQELWDSIDAIYVITMNHIWSPVTNIDKRILPNETPESLSKRLQDPVTEYILKVNEERKKSGRMELTVDFKDSLRAAAVQAWSVVTVIDVHYDPDGKRSGTFLPSSGFEQSGGKNEDCVESMRLARNVLAFTSQAEKRRKNGIFLPCVSKTYLSIALYHLAGVIAVSRIGKDRPTTWRGGYVRDNVTDTDNHSWGFIVYKEGNTKVRMAALGIKPKEFVLPANCSFDTTFLSASPGEWEMARKAKHFPNPQFGIAAVGHPAAKILFHTVRMQDPITIHPDGDPKRIAGPIKFNDDYSKADVSSVQSIIDAFDKYTGEVLSGR